KDFSYRVSKAYKLIYTPHARLYHYEAPQMRPNGYREISMFVIFTHYFFKSHVKKRPLQWVFFAYAFWGYLLSRTLVCLLSPKKHNFNKLKGLIGGLYEVIVHGEKIVK
ncbi:MAG: hypothetical protein HQK97_10540, partial [Nitrospirae bacterium]|nr:hypothetical protein [Nitrospirota bacterium]